MGEHSKSGADEILTSFHEQFSENQNHHQTIFIQFLSAILAVLIGYGYIYANTTSEASMFDILRLGDKSDLLSYSIIHLIGTYLIAQMILILLGTVTLNIGYSFRRDQKVVNAIRKKYLTDSYNSIFDIKSYKGDDKNVIEFLPEFNRMFIIGVFVLQGFLYLSIIYALPKFNNFNWFNLSPWLVDILALTPIICTFLLYMGYYKKYVRKVYTKKTQTVLV